MWITPLLPLLSSPIWLGVVVPLLYNCWRIFLILSYFVGYILSFGLVRLRTIRLSARVGPHIVRRCSRLRGEDVTNTDVIIKTPDRKYDWGYEWGHARKRWAEDFGLFWKKCSWLRFEIRQGELIFGARRGQASWESTKCAAGYWLR